LHIFSYSEFAFPVKNLLNSAVLRQNPVRGTVIFACIYFAANFASDWLFRWSMGNSPMPPLWAIFTSTGVVTAISSLVVYLLLSFTNRQQEALEELNHELRNALQILSYAVPQCDGETRPKAEEAIESMSSTLRRISQRLGLFSAKELRPRRD
jgi:hypothetical protein